MFLIRTGLDNFLLNAQRDDHATHYSYDIHGNVKTLFQDNRKLSAANSVFDPQRFKRIDYDYDLVSGKVNLVSMQKDQPDQFYHKYVYDSDNRLTKVLTSTNGIQWEYDAKYFYYKHGPLARLELGQNQVQGVDYAYTLQGWLKGVNSNNLDTMADMGKDGGSGNPNESFATDAYGYTLNYFRGDYEPIAKDQSMGKPHGFEATTTGSDVISYTNNLYNGNISMMATTIAEPLASNTSVLQPLPQANAYKYDQLNRLLRSKSFTNLSSNTWATGTTYANRFRNDFAYDANGSIMNQLRDSLNGAEVGTSSSIQYPILNSNLGGLSFVPALQSGTSLSCPNCNIVTPQDPITSNFNEAEQEVLFHLNDSLLSELNTWLEVRKLYEKLLDTKSWLDSSIILNNFYDSLYITPLGQLVDIQKGIQVLFDSSNGNFDSFLMQYQLENLKLLNSGISTLTIYDNNVQKINELYLKVIATDKIDFAIDDENTLWDMAYRCPYWNGPSVYLSRGILSLKYDSLSFNDDSLCIYNLNFRRQKDYSDEISNIDFYVFPNPSNGNLNIQFLAKDLNNCSIEIYNVIGEKYRVIHLDDASKNIRVELNDLSTGIYIILLKVNNIVLKSQKFVIQR